MPSDEPMVMLTCRVPRLLRDRVDELASRTAPEGEKPDRSVAVRRLLADGTRRALAAATHPALLPDDLRPPGPAA